MVRMSKYITQQADHVAPHHAWAYVQGDCEFTAAEHDHVLACAHCVGLVQLCVKSPSFGFVLKALGEESPERRSA